MEPEGSRMIFKNFEYFLKIAELGNVSKAAENLHISQPSLSKYIKRLEENLQTELFDHSSSPLRLTYAGERYLAHINDYLQLEAGLKKDFLDIKSQSRGKVVIGIGQWSASVLMPHILPSFWQQYPEIEVVLREGARTVLEPLIEKNQVDFCITNLPMFYKDISYEILMHEPILLAVNSKNPLLGELRLPIRFDLDNIVHLDFTKTAGQFFILPQGQNISVYVNGFMNKYSFRPARIFKTESISTALGLVSAGLGVTFVPFRSVLFENYPKDLSFYTIGDPICTWDFGIAYKSNTIISRQARLFIDHIRNSLDDRSKHGHFLKHEP